MRKVTLISVLLIIILSCSSIKKIPEISPNLTTDTYENLSLSPTVFALIKYSNSIFIIDRNGKIYSLSISDEMLDTFIDLGKPITDNITIQNGLLVVSNKNQGEISIVDLKGKKTSSYIIHKKKRILGINNKFLVYKKNKKIIFFNYNENTIVDSIGPITEKIFNCEVVNDKSFILTEKSLIIYNFKKKTKKKTKLDTTASSPFLLVNKRIFFGDTSHNLVSFSTESYRIKWKYRLPMILKLKPLFAKGMVIVTPEDNNLYFITKRGGLDHWFLSNNIRNKEPVLMKENVAMFFLNPKGIAIGFYGIKDKTSQIHTEKSITFVSQPVSLNGYIYSIVTLQDESEIKIIKIGNKFGSILKTEPLSDFHTDTPIKFTVSPVNIIKPEINITIYDSSGDKVFTKHISRFDPESFIWIPASEGKFTVEISTSGKNGIFGKEIKEINVTDVKKRFMNILWKILNGCNKGRTLKHKKNEKKDRNFPIKK